MINRFNDTASSTMKALSDIGLVGLAVMGENLILNMESKGYTVTAYQPLDGQGRRLHQVVALRVKTFVASSSVEAPGRFAGVTTQGHS